MSNDYKLKQNLSSIEYKILYSLVDKKYTESYLKDRISKLVKDLKAYTEQNPSVEDHHIAKYITPTPRRTLSDKYKDILEDFFNVPNIFNCRDEDELENYFLDKENNHQSSKLIQNELILDDKTIIDPSKDFFNKMGLAKLIDFEISEENYHIFLKNHHWAKEFAHDKYIASNYFETALDLSKSSFFEVHNYYAFCIAHQIIPNGFLLEKYYLKNNKIGADVVIMELLNIYNGIIGGFIKCKNKLIEKYNIWYNRHKNSEIGKWNIPLFEKVNHNLSNTQKELIKGISKNYPPNQIKTII